MSFPPEPSCPEQPIIVLVRPQLGENIGAVARAMLNCGLDRLRLVAPRDGWPSASAHKNAAGADHVLEAANLYDTLPEAIADCHLIIASSARRRDRVARILTPHAAAVDLHKAILTGQRPAILFGAERSGLNNDEMTLAAQVIEIPLNPDFCSLNLAQAVLLVVWEYHCLHIKMPQRQLFVGGGQNMRPDQKPATGGELQALFMHLEEELQACGFLFLPEKRPGMVRNIRAMLQRADLTRGEVQTLRGIIRCLTTQK